MRLKIGDFARIAQVTVQTLRHYDDLGLLPPAEVDALSGYRYYLLDQLPRLHRILALKDLGFSLEQISHLLAKDLPLAEVQGMLRLKQGELRQQVQEQLDRLERIEARLRQMENEGRPPKIEVVVKPVEALRVASVRRIIPSYWDEEPVWAALFEAMGQARLTPTGPCLTLYHSGEPDIDIEGCAPVPLTAAGAGEMQVRTLPRVDMMASTLHRGPFTGLAETFGELLAWVHENGYRVAGPDREVFLRLPEPGASRTDPNAITEMQIPIQRE